MKEFAANVHERRLRGLYVSIDVGDGELPQQAVSDSQCETLIELLRATLAVVDLHEFKELDEQQKSDLEWFMSVREEPDKAAAIFSGSSLERLRDSGNPREWIHSRRVEQAQLDAQMKAIAEQELSMPRRH